MGFKFGNFINKNFLNPLSSFISSTQPIRLHTDIRASVDIDIQAKIDINIDLKFNSEHLVKSARVIGKSIEKIDPFAGVVSLLKAEEESLIIGENFISEISYNLKNGSSLNVDDEFFLEVIAQHNINDIDYIDNGIDEGFITKNDAICLLNISLIKDLLGSKNEIKFVESATIKVPKYSFPSKSVKKVLQIYPLGNMSEGLQQLNVEAFSHSDNKQNIFIQTKLIRKTKHWEYVIADFKWDNVVQKDSANQSFTFSIEKHNEKFKSENSEALKQIDSITKTWGKLTIPNNSNIYKFENIRRFRDVLSELTQVTSSKANIKNTHGFLPTYIRVKSKDPQNTIVNIRDGYDESIRIYAGGYKIDSPDEDAIFLIPYKSDYESWNIEIESEGIGYITVQIFSGFPWAIYFLKSFDLKQNKIVFPLKSIYTSIS